VTRKSILSMHLKSLFDGFSGRKSNPEISNQFVDTHETDQITRPTTYADKQEGNLARKESRKPGNQSAAVFMPGKSHRFWRTHHDGTASHTPSFLG